MVIVQLSDRDGGTYQFQLRRANRGLVRLRSPVMECFGRDDMAIMWWLNSPEVKCFRVAGAEVVVDGRGLRNKCAGQRRLIVP